MNMQQKKVLALTPRKLTFEGVPCKVAGWANDYATITADFPGFYQAGWMWEAAVLILCVGGLLLSMTSVIVGWRFLRR